MSSNWKDQLKDVKRRLEDQKMKELLKTRATEREAQKPLIKKIAASKSVQQSPKHPVQVGLSKQASSSAPLLSNYAPLPPKPPCVATFPKFTIGIDFGTSTTKICARRHKGVIPNDPEPIYLAHLDGNDSCLCPSSVLIKDDRFYFGHEAEGLATSSASSLRHLKACLACEVDPAQSIAFAECSSMRNASTLQCVGSFKYAHPFSASQLVTLYLGWVMHESRRVLSKVVGPKVSFTYHIGLPLEKFDEATSFAKEYEKLSYYAWRISEGIVQGLDINKAAKWLKEVTNEDLPRVESSPVQLAPEIVASLVPFINGSVKSVSLSPGLYGLVDIGAWTTDVAMFRYSNAGLVTFPVTSVRRMGCNLIDDRLRSGLLELIGESGEVPTRLLSEIRTARENGSFDTSSLRVGGYRLVPPSSLQDYCLRVASAKVWRQFVLTVKAAHNEWKEPYQEEAFAKFEVFILGGGSNIDLLVNAPAYLETAVTKSVSALPGIPANFERVGTSHNHAQLPSSDYRRLAIAHGLSFAAGTWPDFIRPSEVRPSMPPPRKDSPTSEDLGYDEK